MASIKLSALVSAARGKVGGNVFSANKAGAFVRTYVKPTNRNTIAQQYVRGLFGTLSSAWRNLTDAQRSQWTTMAVQYPYMNRLGDMATYTGQQLYNKLLGNFNACSNAPALDAAPPAFISVPTSPQEFFPMSQGISQIDQAATQIPLQDLLIDGIQEIPTGYGVIVEATAPLSAGITSPQKGLFKAIGFISQNSDMLDTALWSALYANYVAIFGTANDGAVCFIQVKQFSYLSGEVTVAQRSVATFNV